MDNREAKKILALYRPGTGDAADPNFAEALELARREPELKAWFENHCTDYLALRAKLRQVSAPNDLRERILAMGDALDTTRFAERVNIWWRQPAFLAAAAMILVLLALVVFLPTAKPGGSFTQYRARMVQTANREYRMDLVTADLSVIRTFLSTNQFHADYALPAPLEQLPGDGCKKMTWQGKKVSMICFDTGATNDLYLFVIQRSELKNAPPTGSPQIARINKLITASWSRNDKTYVLAGRGDEQFIRKYL